MYDIGEKKIHTNPRFNTLFSIYIPYRIYFASERSASYNGDFVLQLQSYETITQVTFTPPCVSLCKHVIVSLLYIHYTWKYAPRLLIQLSLIYYGTVWLRCYGDLALASKWTTTCIVCTNMMWLMANMWGRIGNIPPIESIYYTIHIRYITRA